MGEVDAIQDLEGQEGVEIRAAKGTIQYKSDMQMQLMFNIAGFVLVIITHFQGLKPITLQDQDLHSPNRYIPTTAHM